MQAHTLATGTATGTPALPVAYGPTFGLAPIPEALTRLFGERRAMRTGKRVGESHHAKDGAWLLLAVTNVDTYVATFRESLGGITMTQAAHGWTAIYAGYGD